MEDVSVRELRNYGGQILDRVERGETVTITRDGRPVARLSPLPTPRLTAHALVERWRGAPRIDGETLRRDIAEILDLDV